MKNSMASSGRITANTYDSVGNIIRVNSSYPMPQYQVTERYTYDSADQLLSAESTCNNNVLCSGAYSYNNWGKINTFTQQTTDPATNTFENKDYRYYFPSSSANMAQGQTSFAPIIKYDIQQNPQPLETCTYGINGSIRKRYDHPTQNTDYYYFNASGNLKACGTDMQISVYGYNSANTRTYKVNLFNANQWVNGQPQPIQPMVQNAMFYPNTYINFTQAGEYTKHYYNGTERICSRLGEQQVSISVENDQELLNYQHDTKEILRNAIGQHLYDEPTDMQEGDVIPLEFLQATGDNNAVFYYHPNHLGSTSFVTDMQQSVVQSFLYAPYGEIISEYNTHVMGEAFPKYSFNAKELDEETGMYYYEARYYAPPVFTSRDPMMEKYFWMSPYAYCSNNPVKYVDPDGRKIRLPNNYKGGMRNIAMIAATSRGQSVVTQLISKPETYTFKSIFFSAYCRYNLYNRTAYYVGNPLRSSIPTDGGYLNSMTAMAHEMFHCYDHSLHQNISAEKISANKNILEPRAVSFANYLRQAYSLYPLRSKYSNINGDFNQFNNLYERITNFTELGGNHDGTCYGFSYTKTIITPAKTLFGKAKSSSKEYFMTVSRSGDYIVSVRIYNNRRDYDEATKDW